MKNESVKRINTMGKFAKIIIVIVMVCVICGIVGSVLGGCASMAISDDSITINGEAQGEITVDTSKLPKQLISFEKHTANLDIKGVPVKFNIDSEEDGDIIHYTFNGSADGVSGKEIRVAAAVACFSSTILLSVLLISLIFAKKLARALETCNSPFEAVVLNRMKSFAKSLIPWAIVSLIIHGITSISTILAVLVIMLLVNIFKYGAELQKDADETV